MLIGELSKKTGFSRDTIRFYEKKGLIELPDRRLKENNYKEYPEYVVKRLILIVSLKELGFTLNEIETFFKLWREDDASCENLVYTLENKATQVDQQIEKFSQLKQRLTNSLQKCRSKECEFEKKFPFLDCK